MCLEVYPHPAMVGLFRLGAVIPYKAKPGRDLAAARRSAFLELTEHLESLSELRLAGHPRWESIRAAVHGATRQVDLERCEDETDAIFCAHLAWLAHHRPVALMTYGTVENGYSPHRRPSCCSRPSHSPQKGLAP